MQQLVHESQIHRFAVGRNLITEGEAMQNVMIIIKGFCEASRIVNGKATPFGTLGLGDTLDLEHVLEPHGVVSYTATATATVDVIVLAVFIRMHNCACS
jgi:CRP-like cAMP-binding protein